jgi:hypothetical protein
LGRRRHPATDADTGRIVASALTGNETDGGSPVGPWLDRMDDPVAPFTGDGADDRADAHGMVASLCR